MQTKFSLLPAQASLVQSRKPVSIFVGGVGSGKTRGAVYKATQLGAVNAPCFGLFIEPTYVMVRDVAFRSFQEVYEEAGIKYDLIKSESIIRVADSFDILFRSGDQPERLYGLNAAWAIIDEPASQSEDVPKVVLQRLRDPRARLKQLVLTGTPAGFNWFYEWAHRGDADVFRARTYDNPHLDPAYIEEMKKKYTDEEIRAYINGEFIRFEGQWYKVFPELASYRTTDSGLKIFREPAACSDQIVIGTDSAGGMGRDSSAVAVIDKRDGKLVASWSSASATLDELCGVVAECDRLWTKHLNPIYHPYTKTPLPVRPYVVVEVDGIGRATWQMLAVRNPPLQMAELKTKEWSRYAGLLAAKRAVESHNIYGPEELQVESRDLHVEKGKFKGRKDLSMAIGFCLNHIARYPYQKPESEVNREILDLQSKLQPRKRGW